jgi:hypothetical protein
VDACVFGIRIVLDILGQCACCIGGKDVSMGGMLVERRTVEVVRRLFGGEAENCSGISC